MKVPFNFFRFINQISGGSLEILHTAIKGFNKSRAVEASAGLAFYFLLSLFPLLVVLISVNSSIFGSEQAIQVTVEIIEGVIPVSQTIIEQNSEQLVNYRGPLGAASLLISLWSAALVFSTLANNINLAWSEAKSRNVINSRFVGLGIVVMLVLFLFLSLITTTVGKILPQYNIPIFDRIPDLDAQLWNIPTTLMPWLFSFLLFYAFYNWIPNIRVSHRATLLSAVIISLFWELTKLK